MIDWNVAKNPNKKYQRQSVCVCERGHECWSVISTTNCVVRTHMWVCLFILGPGAGDKDVLAVRWLVVVLFVLGQRRPGLLHFLSFLSAPTATGFGRINHHTELLAQVCHLIWKEKKRATTKKSVTTTYLPVNPNNFLYFCMDYFGLWKECLQFNPSYLHT